MHARDHARRVDCRDRRRDSGASEACRIARPLDAEPPVLERGLAIHLQLLGSGQRRCDRPRLECCNKGARHSGVDLHATNVEAIAAAPLDEMLAGTVISGRRSAPPVMCAQTAAAMPAAGEALQKCAAFSHGAACLVRPRSRVAGDALLVGLIGLPVDVTSMMLFDQHLPLIARQTLDSFAPRTRRLERHLHSRLAIDVGACIDGVAQYLVDGVVARLNPTDLGVRAHLQRKLQPLIAEPQPHAARRAGFCEAGEDGADHRNDGLIGMKQNLAVGLTPHEAHGQATPQFATCGLVADAAVEAGPAARAARPRSSCPSTRAANGR